MEANHNIQHQWTPEDNLQAAQTLKDQGNQQFKEKNFKESLRAYHKAILHLAGIIDKTSAVAAYTNKVAPENITNQANQLKFSLYMNMAQIYIIQTKYDRGLEVLNKAKIIKTNQKFYYRRAICLMNLSEFDQARSDLITLIDIDPPSRPQAERLLIQLQTLQKQQDQKSKAMFQKFFK